MEKTPLEYFESHFHLSEEDLRRELHKAAIGGEDLLNRPFSTLTVGQKETFHATFNNLGKAKCTLVR
jgi:hypothetical protein